METIRILGGGIAGLTAAITLRKAGYEVEVHEKKRFCGKHTADHQYLENWTFDPDVLEYLRSIGIASGFYCKPIYTQTFFAPSGERYTGQSQGPLMYLVKRGAGEDSIDQSLCKQAETVGVRILYEAKFDRSKAEIISTGSENPTAVATGVRFCSDLPDQSAVLLDNELSQNFYSYFIVNDGEAEIVSCNGLQVKDVPDRLQRTIERFEQLLNIKAGQITERFACVCDFRTPVTAKIGKQLYVGEAAGFQDQLGGFGMGYAFRSGYLAAQTIIKKQDYDGLWKREFFKPLRISIWNKRLFAGLGNENYETVVGLLNSQNPFVRWLRGGDDLRRIMRRLYTHPIAAVLYSASTLFGIRGFRRV
jgi:flavin-dependent dehydrogenase